MFERFAETIRKHFQFRNILVFRRFRGRLESTRNNEKVSKSNLSSANVPLKSIITKEIVGAVTFLHLEYLDLNCHTADRGDSWTEAKKI